VVLVDDRRPDLQIRQISNNGFRVAGPAPAPAAADAFPQQLVFRDDGQRRARGGRGKSETFIEAGHGDGQGRFPLQEGSPAIHRVRVYALVFQSVAQVFPAASRVGHEQGAAIEVSQEGAEALGRCLGPGQ
jgi:hypothetical protein